MKRKSKQGAARWTPGLRKLKAISIRQPWAWLIVNGYKDVENRIWVANLRGPVLIHAGQSKSDATPEAPFAPPGPSSTQERLLEGELKLRHRTGRRGEDLTQMLDGVAEGIGLRTGGRFLPATQNAAQFVQASPQTGEQVIPFVSRNCTILRGGSVYLIQ